jgi:hypothetical protein
VARRFPSRSSVPVQMSIRKTDISVAEDAAAAADAAGTWTPPILPTQCVRRISCIGSKDTCTSHASQGNCQKRRYALAAGSKSGRCRTRQELRLRASHFTFLAIPFNTVDYLGGAPRSRIPETTLTPNARQTRLQGSGMQYKPPSAGFNKFGPTSYLAWFYRQIPIGGYCAPD